ncbi:MAG: NAD(P)H-hydrate dehydratase [Anaerovibrio sp.]|uniref:NAD(P)H-hydrate dehydratase n=1 Tax=Anaerovibrio sp. TaxID=1872532 RepID=UPI0025EFF3C4|nr:NAD(P)H-hydrate dehydratase [Anaerovibrio sp.]MCR5177271.1 NAD(P)H-hydrate dehydratase [Anaerovibrio sp.]
MEGMRIPLPEEMKAVDGKIVEELGLPEIVLVENAGRSVYKALKDRLGFIEGAGICIIAGTGNNGGDALVTARYIYNAGGIPSVFIVGMPERMSPATAANYKVLTSMGIDAIILDSEAAMNRLARNLSHSDFAIDGIMGTGYSGRLRDNVKTLIQMINDSDCPVLAIDVPTGVDASTGAVTDTAIRADVTVTLFAPKWGLFFSPGREYTGIWQVKDIGVPASILADYPVNQTLINSQLASANIRKRALDVHKGKCGRILVVAGSRGMTGAAALASKAALRAGAGVVTLACADSLNNIFETLLPEIMTMPVEESETGEIGRGALVPLLNKAEDYDVVLLGPGLGRNAGTMDMVRDFISASEAQLVIDADALFALRGRQDLLRSCKRIPVLTPHLGEMAALLDITVEQLRGDLLGKVRAAAFACNAIFVVKSECTVVVYPDGRAYATGVGNPGMATAGSGDVLAGVIAGMVQQTCPGAAPLVGVYIHGRAGDIAGAEKGNGLIASDIINSLGSVLIEIDVAGL